MNQQQPQTIIVQHVGQSSLGTAGLIFSCIGWLTCGLLCIPGAFFSFFGLFSNKQKSHAIAGLIVGFPGVLFFMFIGAAFILPLLGLGALVGGAAVQQAGQAIQNTAPPPQTTDADSPMLTDSIPVDEAPLFASMPDAGQPPIPDPLPKKVEAPLVTTSEPQSRYHTFLDITGKHKVVAELVAVKNNWVKLKREDGKEITMPISKLSKADQQWVKDNPPR